MGKKRKLNVARKKIEDKYNHSASVRLLRELLSKVKFGQIADMMIRGKIQIFKELLKEYPEMEYLKEKIRELEETMIP